MDDKAKLIKRINNLINEIIKSDETIISEYPQSEPESVLKAKMRKGHEKKRVEMLSLVDSISKK